MSVRSTVARALDPASSGRVAGRSDPAPARTLAVVCVAVFMLLLDVTVVMVALAGIQRDIGGDLASLQWVIDAYTLGLAALLLTAATLGDRIGRRRVFRLGLVVFTLASAGCSVAGSPVQLDLIRAVQGLGGALLFGTALPLVGAAFPAPAQRGRAIAAFGATLSGATAVGPLVGGLLVDGPGWRWIFVLNLPIGVFALLGTRWIAESRSPSARRADWPGAVLLTAGLLALLLGLIRGTSDGWGTARIIGLLVAAALLIAAFLAREARARAPMLDLGLFRRRRFTGVAIGAFAVSASLIAASAYLPLFFQLALGYSPLATGLRILPMTVAAFVASPLTGVLMHRASLGRLVALSLALVGIGMISMCRADPHSRWTVLLPGLVVAGIGFGISGAALSAGALSTVEPDRAGMATGTVNTLRQVGIAAGVAALGAIFQRAVTLPSGAVRVVTEAERVAVADGLRQVMATGAVLALLAAVACLLLINTPEIAHGGRRWTTDRTSDGAA